MKWRFGRESDPEMALLWKDPPIAGVSAANGNRLPCTANPVVRRDEIMPGHGVDVEARFVYVRRILTHDG